MKKRKYVILGIALLTIVLLTVVIFSGKEKRNVNNHLKLGNKYLSEQRYDEAKAEYDKVIEMSPKNVEAYLGLGEIFFSLAIDYINSNDTEYALTYYNKALDSLNAGLKKTNDPRISSRINEIKEELIDNGIDTELLVSEESNYDNAESIEPDSKEVADSEKESNSSISTEAAYADFFGPILDELKIFGYSINEIMNMSKNDFNSNMISNYGLYRNYEKSDLYYVFDTEKGNLLLNTDTNKFVYTYRLSDDSTMPYDVVDVSNDANNGYSFSFSWDYANLEYDLVSYPSNLFLLDSSWEEIGNWLDQRGINYQYIDAKSGIPTQGIKFGYTDEEGCPYSFYICESPTGTLKGRRVYLTTGSLVMAEETSDND